MLAGRKLLLADDSITIQKVVDLTFADEGVSVVCVSNGQEAIERLEVFLPDVVLADAFMPLVNGYEVCEFIRQNDKLKHIPVMLLVGSFEPFDEKEARRVGANDVLTKPFQSIRRLIDRVGLLVGSRPSEEQIPTAELPKPEVPEPEVEKLTTAELEITTADTQPLPPELRHVMEGAASASLPQEAVKLWSDAKVDNGMMESTVRESSPVLESDEGSGEVLLDLGDLSTRSSGLDEEFVLDIDLDEAPEPSPVEPAFQTYGFRGQDRYSSIAQAEPGSAISNWSPATVTAEAPVTTPDQPATPQQYQRIVDEPVEEPAPVRITDQPIDEPAPATLAYSAVVEAPVGYAEGAAIGEQDSPATVEAPTAASPGEISLEQLSPEMIDAIARRAVEQLSEKVVQQIAWEVVPQLAELLIKRQLEEKNS